MLLRMFKDTESTKRAGRVFFARVASVGYALECRTNARGTATRFARGRGEANVEHGVNVLRVDLGHNTA